MTFPVLALLVLMTASAAALTARYTRQYEAAALVGGTIILFLHSVSFFHYTSDDAYISYRYARNLSDGLGLVWNPGEYVEGYSNFLWVVILATLHKLGADIVQTGRWLGFVLGIGVVGATYVLCTHLVRETAGRLAGVAAALLLAACGSFAVWTTGGLEVPLFALLVLGAVLLHLRESDGYRPPLSGAVWALAAMTRPEAPLLFAVAGAFKCAELAMRARALPAEERRGALTREAGWLGAWAAGFVVLYAPYFAWRYATYDHFFPNTYYAKVGEGSAQYNRGLGYLATFAREYAAWLVLIAPLAIAFASIRKMAAAFVLALILAYCGYIVYVGGDSLVRFRFFAPIVPLMYALIASSGAALLQAVRFERPPPRWALEAAVAASVGGLLLFTLQASTNGTGTVAGIGERRAVEERAEIGRWLRANMPATTSLAIVPAGAIPYESRLETIDMLGINNEHIAHRELDIGSFPAGHEKYDSQYVLDQQPDIIILFDALTPDPRRRESYAGLAQTPILALVDMVNTPRLWQEYEARSVEVREGAWFNLLVRNDASDVLARTQRP